jgi:antibiotic biosynthesis monooxygenase (ABM) superfamily enzyme
VIVRTWHGWTRPADADRYQELLLGRIVPGIFDRRIPGLTRLQVLRRDAGDEVEFVTVMSFDDWAAVEEFAGPGATSSVVPTEARVALSHHDEHSQHYEQVGDVRR